MKVATFTARDGKQVKFPLDYLVERRAILADKINGESMKNVLGCYNQLWIPGCAGKWFVRDVVDISFSEEEGVEPPKFEKTAKDYTNRPNVFAKASAGPNMLYRIGAPASFEGWGDDYDKDIVAIEFTLDGGRTWTRKSTERAHAGRWVYWNFDFTPEKAGYYRLVVRSVNEDGDVTPIPAYVEFEVI